MTAKTLEEEACKLCEQRPQSAFEKEGLCERCRHVAISNLHKFRTPYPEPQRMPWPLTQALAIARRYLRFWTQEKTATLRHENNQIRKRNEKLTAASAARDKEIEELRAKLEAVPVEEIRGCARECRNTWPEEGIADDARAIDRWLAGLTK